MSSPQDLPLAAAAPPCTPANPSPSAPHFSNCTHCGFCLAVCPTYQLTGDENNSPRGRIRLWSDEFERKMPANAWTDHYTSECVGCLACETACPAGVPYGELFEKTRHAHVESLRHNPSPALRFSALLAANPPLMNLAGLPARIARRTNLPIHPLLPPGRPALMESTAEYAQRLVRTHQPKGPRVALLTGCLMESVFRDINFATVRVLIASGCQVEIPENQTCCGAFQEHTGLGGCESLREKNRHAFTSDTYDFIATNSSGCGHSLAKSLSDTAPVIDVLSLLGEIGVPSRKSPDPQARLYVDLPCHLVHGQKTTIPKTVLDATGIPWQYAPNASDCCGSGGVYNLEKPENARAILEKKSRFLESASGDPVILGTANHVCLMQWYSAGSLGLVKRPYLTKHLIELLDPEPSP